jgi:signal transduction histidine kinase
MVQRSRIAGWFGRIAEVVRNLPDVLLTVRMNNRLVPDTYEEELNELCRIFTPYYGMLCSVVWLPYISVDRVLVPDEPLIGVLRVGLSVLAVASMAIARWGKHPLRFKMLGNAAVYYILLATAAITGLADAHPSYIGGYCFLITVFPATPIAVRHLLTALGLSLALFIGLCVMNDVSFASNSLRYSMQDLLSASVVFVFLTVMFDRFKRRFHLQALRLQSINETLKLQQHELKRQAEELAQARDRAEQADALKTEFVQNLNHEIRTPLTAIQGFSEILTLHVSSEHQVYLYRILEASKHLSLLFDDMLVLSQSATEHKAVSPEVVDIQQFGAQTCAMFQALTDQKGLAFEYQCTERVPRYLSIPLPTLRQILVNLIGNAVKFTHAGSVRATFDFDTETPLSLGAVQYNAGVNSKNDNSNDSSDGDSVPVTGSATLVVTVEDTGIGIPPEALNVIFEAFHQQDSSTTRRFGGLGIGLTVCKRLVDELGGTLEVQSAQGIGSRFTVRLPVFVGENAR